jgi:hypothetical protein
MQLKHLRALCNPDLGSVKKPFIRSYGGHIYTVATQGHAVLAVRGELTTNQKGPPSFFTPMRWRRRVRYEWAPLKAFLLKPRTPDDRGTELVRIAGTVVNAALARRFIRRLDAATVEVAGESGALFRARSAAMKTPGALLIRCDDWIVVVMAIYRPEGTPDVFRGRKVRRRQ